MDKGLVRRPVRDLPALVVFRYRVTELWWRAFKITASETRPYGSEQATSPMTGCPNQTENSSRRVRERGCGRWIRWSDDDDRELCLPRLRARVCS
jgi:hypothetical protein